MISFRMYCLSNPSVLLNFDMPSGRNLCYRGTKYLPDILMKSCDNVKLSETGSPNPADPR